MRAISLRGSTAAAATELLAGGSDFTLDKPQESLGTSIGNVVKTLNYIIKLSLD